MLMVFYLLCDILIDNNNGMNQPNQNHVPHCEFDETKNEYKSPQEAPFNGLKGDKQDHVLLPVHTKISGGFFLSGRHCEIPHLNLYWKINKAPFCSTFSFFARSDEKKAFRMTFIQQIADNDYQFQCNLKFWT